MMSLFDLGPLKHIVPIVALVVVGLGLILAARTKWFQKTALFFLALPAAFVLWLIGSVATLLWRPMRLINNAILNAIPLDKWSLAFLQLPAKSRANPLVRGDRRQYAETLWPQAAYPDLYADVPEDIRRPPYEDGRLLGGYNMTILADRHLTESVYRSAVRGGFNAAVLAFVICAVFLVLQALLSIISFFPALFHGADARPIIEQWPGVEPVRFSVWSVFGANFGHETVDLLGKLARTTVYIPAAAVASVGVGILVALVLLRSWMHAKGQPYEHVTKDADVRWPNRIESRNLLRETYRNQVAHAVGYLKGKAVFPVGVASGTLRARGDLAAPAGEQKVCLDEESLFQHLLVFGGTGEGKTTALLKPLLRQVLADKRFGAFVTDAKGVLWRDARNVARDLGREADVIVIGTGKDDHGFNVTAGLTPAQVSAALRSVLTQISGSTNNNFWPDMAAGLIRHMLTVGEGYARTEAGITEARKGLNPYSLWWAYQAILRQDMLNVAMDTIDATYALMLENIQKAAPDAIAPLAARAREFMTPELRDSMAYLQSAWRDMASETKTGIIANVTQLLDGFASSSVLRERFASGRDEGAIGVRGALDGKIVLNALSSIEDGLPARLVSILIKTSLYREARRREGEWRGTEPPRKPQDSPCLVVMDEVQELATVDPVSGLSDASFWNVARSTGLAGVFATQTVSALTQAMGEAAARNFMQQARSKIFFRTEEKETVEYACWAAGTYERNRVFEDGQRESLDFRKLIDGWEPLLPVDETEAFEGGPHAFFGAARALLSPESAALTRATARETYSADMRFIATDATPGGGSNAGSAGNSARMGSLQAAHWRAEDLTRSYRTQGNEMRAALAPADMMHLGRWLAFAQVQRAGAVRQDIIRVQHDFSEG